MKNKKINYEKYSLRLEKAWAKDRAQNNYELQNWVNLCFDYAEAVKNKNTLATKLFLIGLLLGSILIMDFWVLSLTW